MFKQSTQFIKGAYERTPVENDWHVVTIEPKGTDFIWKNKAGHQWNLSAETYGKDKKLRTGKDCPYQGKDVSVVTDSGGEVTALCFQGELYMADHLVKTAQPHEMVQTKKKVIKVTYKGEMKRMKATSEFETLVMQTQKAFGNSLPHGFKFYYLDEDSEMVSINSQFDLDQAIDIEELTVLKLTASASAKEARAQLCQDISDVMSMTDNLNQSGFFTAPSTERESLKCAFDTFRTNAKEEKKAKADKESLKGAFDSFKLNFQESFKTKETVKAAEKPLTDTELVKLFGQELPKCKTPGCNFQQKSKKSAFCCGKCKKGKKKHSKGCYKISAEEAPVDKEGSEEPTKAEAKKEDVVNEIADMVGEVSKMAFETFEKVKNHMMEKHIKKSEHVHARHICDGCEAHGIVGVRYKCSVCHDFDLCAICEAKGVHAEHPMLKIRDPAHAPEQIICEYNHIETPSATAEIIRQLKEQHCKPAEIPEPVEEKPIVVDNQFKDSRTYAEVVKGVKKEMKTDDFGYPIIDTDTESERTKPVVCTLSPDFLKTTKVQESDPRTIYNDKTILIQDSAVRESLYNLYELGQVNFEVNVAMLKKYKNDVSKTASHLMEGDLSESIIHECLN